MILVLSGTAGGRDLLKALAQGGYSTLCSAETVYEAAEFGSGQTVTGSLDKARLINIIKEYNISGVMCALREDDSDTFSLAAEACGQSGTPCLRYFPCKREYLQNPRISVCADYTEAVSELNRNIGNALLLVAPAVAKLIAGSALSRTSLYLPILKGIDADIELALSCGLPMRNAIQVDGLESSEDIAAVIKKYDIHFLVCHDTNGIEDKIAAAEQAGILTILVGRYEAPFPRSVYSAEEALEVAASLEM